MGNNKIDLVIDFFLKNKTLIVVKKRIAKGGDLLIEEKITSLILNKIDEFKMSLNNISEIKISLTKNVGTEKESSDNASIYSDTLESLASTEILSKYVGDTVYQLLKALNFKPTVVTVK